MAYVGIPVAIRILKKDTAFGREYWHIRHPLLNRIHALLCQFLIADYHLPHIGISHADPVGSQYRRQHLGDGEIHHTFIDNRIIYHRQAAVNPRLENLLRSKTPHLLLVIPVDRAVLIQIPDHIGIQHGPAVMIQLMVIGEIEKHFLRNQTVISSWKGIQKILIQPGQAYLLFQCLLIPRKIARPR